MLVFALVILIRSLSLTALLGSERLLPLFGEATSARPEEAGELGVEPPPVGITPIDPSSLFALSCIVLCAVEIGVLCMLVDIYVGTR